MFSLTKSEISIFNDISKLHVLISLYIHTKLLLKQFSFLFTFTSYFFCHF
jgi:hypothetical protein